MKTILITGIGFIMRNFVEMYHKDFNIICFDDLSNYASQAKHVEHLKNVEVYDIDISDWDAVLDGFKSVETPALVIHAAAESHVCNSITDPGRFIKTNVLGTQNILEACKIFQVRHTLYISTDEVLKHCEPAYGEYIALSDQWVEYREPFFHYSRVSEEANLSQVSFDTSSVYSASKASGELLVNAYRDTHGLPVTVVRPTNNYGPYQNQEKLIPKTITRALGGEKIPVFKTTAYRDWLYVEDCCRGIRLIMDQIPGETYHISAQDEKETLYMVRKTLELLKVSPNLIEMVDDRLGYDLYYSLNSTKLRKLGWEPKVSLKEGLSRTIESITSTKRAIR